MKLSFAIFFWHMLDFLYKCTLAVGILAIIITVSFFIDFIDVSDLKFENVIKGNIIIIFIIAFRFCFKKYFSNQIKQLENPDKK